MSGVIPGDSTTVSVVSACFTHEGISKQERGKGDVPTTQDTMATKSSDSNNPASNANDDYNLQRHLRPFLFFLQLTGLLRGRVEAKGQGEATHAVCTPRDLCLHVHCVLTLILLWLNAALVLVGLADVRDFDGVLCNQLVTAAWFLQVALAATHHFRQSSRLLKLLQDFSDHTADVQLQMKVGARRLAIAVVVGYLVWTGCALTFGSLSSLFTSLPPVFGNPGQAVRKIVNVMLVLMYLSFSSAWFFLTALYIVLAYLLVRAFRHHAQCLDKQVQSDGTFTGDVEKSRRHHDRVCRLLDNADKLVRAYLLLAIGTAIPVIVFTIYFVLFQEVGKGQLLAVWWSVALAVLQLVIVFLAGGAVNHVAHSALLAVYSIDLTSLTHVQTQHLMVLLTRLTSQPLGLTACSLFVIDKPTIITFTGTIITYAVVVVQFRPDSMLTSPQHGNVTACV